MEYAACHTFEINISRQSHFKFPENNTQRESGNALPVILFIATNPIFFAKFSIYSHSFCDRFRPYNHTDMHIYE